jgi:hypothetical protein
MLREGLRELLVEKGVQKVELDARLPLRFELEVLVPDALGVVVYNTVIHELARLERLEVEGRYFYGANFAILWVDVLQPLRPAKRCCK